MSFSNAWKWKVKVKLLNHVQLLATPWTAAHQAPPSMGFSRQEYWSGVPLPSLLENEKKTYVQAVCWNIIYINKTINSQNYYRETWRNGRHISSEILYHTCGNYWHCVITEVTIPPIFWIQEAMFSHNTSFLTVNPSTGTLMISISPLQPNIIFDFLVIFSFGSYTFHIASRCMSEITFSNLENIFFFH